MLVTNAEMSCSLAFSVNMSPDTFQCSRDHALTCAIYNNRNTDFFSQFVRPWLMITPDVQNKNYFSELPNQLNFTISRVPWKQVTFVSASK